MAYGSDDSNARGGAPAVGGFRSASGSPQPAPGGMRPGGASAPGTPGGWPGDPGGGARPPGRPGATDHMGWQGPPQTGGAQAQAPTSELRRPAAQAPTPVEAPTPALPKGGGAIRSIAEKFSANPATGTGSMTIPIATSPGRGGFGPELAVSYDSGAGNGPFGVGWSLTVPSIGRKTDKGIPRYRDDLCSDIFILSGAEDLVPLLVAPNWHNDVVTDGTLKKERFRPRVEGGFARIERVTDTVSGNVYWQATTKDNVVSVYGKTAAARVADPENARLVFRWLLEETRDDKGNFVLYQYKAENLDSVPFEVGERHHHEGRAPVTANRYLKRILYGNKAGVASPTTADDFHFEVVFDYGEHHATVPTPAEASLWPARQDPSSSHRSGFEIRGYRLCRRVLLFHRNFSALESGAAVLVRSTDFTFDESPIVTYLLRATHKGYIKNGASYDAQALPAVDFDYTRATITPIAADLDAESARHLPAGVDGRAYQWVDLDGEGIPGVLSQGPRAIYYQRNLGQGKLAPPRALSTQPSLAQLESQQLLDVTGDGVPDLVAFGRSVGGYHPRTLSEAGDESWGPLQSFGALPNVDWNDPSIRFIDLDGDGFADLMMSGDHVYTWYPSLRQDGFGPPHTATRYSDEQLGPTAVFAEREQTVFLADMTGDGLTDLVRIRNGSVCYWPNLGHGRFGPMVVMGDAPTFAPDNLFSPQRVRLADLDGSGPADLLYLGERGVTLWRNQSGKGFAVAETAGAFPGHDGLASLDVVDVLGNGTSALVWSSPLAGRAPQVRYVDLFAGMKPHLLVSVKNNLGLETTITYASSTKLYLADRAAGRRWVTRLPFPVHVVERVEHHDKVSKHRFVSTYAYRHGFYDSEEREFRGFGYVEQRDAESVGQHFGQGLLPSFAIANGEMPQPPVVTKTWFHTGAALVAGPSGKRRLTDAFASEWYTGGALLAMPAFEGIETAVEVHQAYRALAGRMLRQEVYAEDGTAEAGRPYSLTEQTWGVRRLQPTGAAPYASFLPLPAETKSRAYERSSWPASGVEPRETHEKTLAVDALGYVTLGVSIAYGRQSGADHAAQQTTWIVASESSFAHTIGELGWYRHGVPLSQKSWELGSAVPHTALAITAAGVVEFDGTLASITKRRLSEARSRYWKNDLSAPLAFGSIESLALPYQSYARALTPTMRSGPLAGQVDSLLTAAGYEEIDSDGHFWAKSGIQHFNDASSFYLPSAVTDAFGNQTTVSYDSYKLFVTQATAPLSLSTSAVIDYRVLAPNKVTDPNANVAEAAFDELGRVIKTAVAGAASEGDTLGAPTAVVAYELDRYADSGLPARVKTEQRETHASGSTRWLVSYSYANGSGHEILAKVQAEPGPAVQLDGQGHPVKVGGVVQFATADPRWVGTGRTVLDNKGNPIKQYEPYFTPSFEYEDDPDVRDWGVTPILHYDPLGRMVRADMPDGTCAKTVYLDPWTQDVYDGNDTAKAGQLWFDAAPSAPERVKATAHKDTPTRSYFDALGRPIALRQHNGGSTYYTEKSILDVSGNLLELVDALDRDCMVYTPGMLGQVLEQTSIDAGTRRMFATAQGQPVKAWGDRGFTERAEYDALRRLLRVYMHDGSTEKLVERLVYGEEHDSAGAFYTKGRLVQHYDQSGVLLIDKYDFKGNLLKQTRRLATNYATTVDWNAIASDTDPETAFSNAASLLESETFVHEYAYDALDRPTSVKTPDASETLPSYNIGGLLQKVDVKVRGGTATAFVDDITYDEKGRRKVVDYANGTVTTYKYDKHSFRLEHFKTERGSDLLQSLAYTFDAAGNIVSTDDTATQAVYFSGSTVSADGDYTYDAIYRLTSAEGREHEAGTGSQLDHADYDPVAAVPHPNNPSGLRRYTQNYAYDAVGNITSFQHGPASGSGGFTRAYTYASGTNRLATTSHSLGTRTYSHDAHGNMQMAHLFATTWDYADRLRHATVTSGQDVYFVYDGAGNRVRKVFVHGSIVEERIYLGGYEVYRKKLSGTLQDERQTLHVADDRSRVCMVETLTVQSGSAVGSPTPRYRYQLDNHLGTVSVEVDESGAVISYEEYHPYGTSAYRAFHGEVSAKRYRYIGCERDEETGLYLMGARYYATWLGRWTAADPMGTVDGANLFAYVRGSPVGLRDPNGTDSSENESLKHFVIYGDPPEPSSDVELEEIEGVGITSIGEGGPEEVEIEVGSARASIEGEFGTAERAKESARGAAAGAQEALGGVPFQGGTPNFNHWRAGAAIFVGALVTAAGLTIFTTGGGMALGAALLESDVGVVSGLAVTTGGALVTSVGVGAMANGIRVYMAAHSGEGETSTGQSEAADKPKDQKMSVVKRRGMASRTVKDAQGKDVEVHGQIESTSKTPGHDETIGAVAEELAKSGEYEYVTMQRSWRTATGRVSKSGKIPDIIAVRRDGRVDVFEVASKSDTQDDLQRRMAEGMNTLPEGKRGTIQVLYPRLPK
jgi:RHS repeat-associated protein